MDWMTFVYLAYSFIAFYFLFLFTLIYLQNRNRLYDYPLTKKQYELSIVVPCYNEEENIGGTIQALLDSDYKGLKKIIVVDDRSTDNSYNIIKQYAKKYPSVIALQTPKNTGKASGAKNYGAKFVKTELIGFTDADSYPAKDAIGKMIGYFDDENAGAVTSLILAKNRGRLIEKLQSIEYKVIAFTRKLLGFVEAIYVTPGPLALYQKKVFDKIGGFDESNLTEDIEVTWSLVHKNYKIYMCLPAKVYTVVPSRFRHWFQQRVRWNMGGLQTIGKYKKEFLNKGMLGYFILPFFVFSWFIGIVGLLFLFYRVFRMFIIRWLSTLYSVQAQATVLSLSDITLAPNLMIFFGVVLMTFSLFMTFVALAHSKEKEFKKHGIIDMVLYMFIYLLAYPIILMTSIYKYATGKRHW